MTTKNEELYGAIEQLMTPERQKELAAFFASIPPVYQQFFLRFMDLRDGIIHDALGEFVTPMLPKLQTLIDGQERIEADIKDIKERLSKTEIKVSVEEKRIEEHERRLNEKKQRIEQIDKEIYAIKSDLKLLKPDTIEAFLDKVAELSPTLNAIKKNQEVILKTQKKTTIATRIAIAVVISVTIMSVILGIVIRKHNMRTGVQIETTKH